MPKWKKSKAGNSLIEFVLFAPWFFFLFTGVMDAGFAIYGLVVVQNAARVAALHAAGNATSAHDQAGACALVISELQGLPNVGAGFSSDCTAQPIRVSVNYCDGTTPCSGTQTSADNGPATIVTVTYDFPRMFQFPIGGFTNVTRSAQMRLRDPLP